MRQFRWCTYLMIFLISNLVASLSTSAQRSTKGIYLIHAETKIPVRDALLKITETNYSVLSDDNGFITFGNIPANTKEVTISCIGFQTIFLDISALKYADNFTTLKLTPKVSSLKEIKVIASSNRGIFKTISDLDIQLRPINNSQEVLLMVPGLFIG